MGGGEHVIRDAKLGSREIAQNQRTIISIQPLIDRTGSRDFIVGGCSLLPSFSLLFIRALLFIFYFFPSLLFFFYLRHGSIYN